MGFDLVDDDDLFSDVLVQPKKQAPPQPAREQKKAEPRGLAGAAAETRTGTQVVETKTNSSRRSPVYIDIETIPDESRADLFGLDPLPTPAEYLSENDSAAPSELLRGTIDDVKAAVTKANGGGKILPRKILQACVDAERKAQKPRKGVVDLFGEMIATIDNEAATIAAATEAQRKTMSVTPEMCRVVALGFAVGNDPAEAMVVGVDGKTEADLLAKFWSLAANFSGPIVGYNVLGFDLPTLFVRSILLGVDPLRKLDLRPWGNDVCDLMQARFPKSGAKKLKDLARLMGIEVPAGDVDGSHVYQLFTAGKLKEIGEYVRSDIIISRELHKRYRGTFC